MTLTDAEKIRIAKALGWRQCGFSAAGGLWLWLPPGDQKHLRDARPYLSDFTIDPASILAMLDRLRSLTHRGSNSWECDNGVQKFFGIDKEDTIVRAFLAAIREGKP